MAKRNPFHIQAWVRWTVVAAVTVGCSWIPTLAGAEPQRVLTLEREVQTGFEPTYIPGWTGEWLVGYDSNFNNGSVLYTIDRGGRRDEILLTIPDAGRIDLYGIAIGLSGEVAVTGGTYMSDGRAATFVARISRDRKQQTVTRTWLYCPIAVALAPDGSIWTIGRVKDDEDTRVVAESVLRRYDSAGVIRASTVTSARGSQPSPLSFLSASSDRVSWFTRNGEYVEFAPDGGEIGRYEGPHGSTDRNITGVALSASNDVIAGLFREGRTEFMLLDRSSRTWIPVTLPNEYGAGWIRVYGFDGNTLVTTSREQATLRRFTVTSADIGG